MKEVRICLIIETRESLKILDELCSNLSLTKFISAFTTCPLSWKSPGIDSPKMLDICREISHVAQLHSKRLSP